MVTAIVRAVKPTRSRVLTLVAFPAILFGFCGLLSAQQARSATPNVALAKKAFSGVKVSGGVSTLVHPTHVTGVTRMSRGQYKVTFDRHMENCSFSTVFDLYGGSTALPIFRVYNGPGFGFSTSNEVVVVSDSASQVDVDSDFDISALCPAT